MLLHRSKKNFVHKDEIDLTIRDKNNHIFNRNIEFSDYYKCYCSERNKYPIIYKNIMMFETTFKSILSYEIISYYKITDILRFEIFIKSLIENTNSFIKSKRIKQNVGQHMLDNISKFNVLMDNYNNINIFMDRLTLSQAITIYRSVYITIHNKIFNLLLNNNLTFGYKSSGSFDDFLNRIIPIRNCIAHFNSLELLITYYDIKNKSLRCETDSNKYKKIITKLSQNDKSPPTV